MTTRPNTAAALGALTAQIEAMNARLDREYAESSKKRDAMASDIADIKDNAIAIDKRVSAVEGDVREMKPAVQSWSSTKSKVMGGIIVIGAVGALVLGLLQYFKEHLVKLIFG